MAHNLSVKLSYLILPFFYFSSVAQTSQENFLRATSANGFERNQGQVADQFGKLHPEIFFLSAKKELTLSIHNQGLTYFFFKKDEEAEKDITGNYKKDEQDKCFVNRIDMLLENASILEKNIRMEEEVSLARNYYQAHCPQGITNVKSYKKITVAGVYPNIDWEIIDRGNEIKQSFIVHPGGNPNDIQLTYKGHQKIKHHKSKLSYTVIGKLGVIQENGLKVVQSGTKNIPSQFSKKSGSIGYAIGEYDKTKDLIIDPDISWATYYGGMAADGPKAICADNAGNTYITGYGQSSNFIYIDPGGGAYYEVLNGFNVDAFFVKFSSANEAKWSTYFGGTSDEWGTDITSDALGNIFVTGYTGSSDMPTLDPGAGNYFQAAIASPHDLFILKFDAGGVLNWGTFFGGTGEDQPNGIVTDATGNVFITGITASTNFPVFNPGGGAYYQATNAGLYDAFFIKLSTTAQLLWSTYYGGTGDDSFTNYGCHDIACDNSGNIFSTGTTASTSFPVMDPGGGTFFDGTKSGSRDAYLIKFTNNGNLLWSTFIGGSSDEMGSNIALSPSGDVYISGITQSTGTFPVLDPGGSAYYQLYAGGTTDFYLSRFNNSGVMTWSTYLGGTSMEGYTVILRHALACNSIGDVYVGGCTSSANFPTLDDGTYFQGTHAGMNDAIFVRFDNTNTMTWSTFYGLSGDQFGTGLVCVGGCVYGTGEYWSSNGPSFNPGLPAYFQGSTGGSDDGFMASFCTCTSPEITISADTVICQGDSLNLFAGGANSYVWSTSDTGSSITVSPTTTTVYSVTGTDTSGCASTVSMMVTVNPIPVISISGDTVICSNESTSLIANGATTYLWNTGNTNDSLNVNPTITTTYSVAGSTLGCTASTSVTVNVTTLPVAGIDFTTSGDCTPLIVHLTNTSTNATNYVWIIDTTFITTDPNPVDTLDETLTLSVQLIAFNGTCSDTTFILTSFLCDTLDPLFIPNVFTPDNDGHNDVFTINATEYQDVSILIFNRWGQQVFSSTDGLIKWNGKLNNNGKACSEGTYFYIFKATTPVDKKKFDLRGHISLFLK